MLDCPICEGTAEATGKEFKFGVFDGKQFRCQSCEKYFNAFYRDGNLKYTVPKASR
jgi:transposase-like protein